MTYRTGNHQPQNVYRDDAYIGVMFDPEFAALVVEALNERVRRTAGPDLPRRSRGEHPPHPTCIDVTYLGHPPRSSWVCGPDCPREVQP